MGAFSFGKGEKMTVQKLYVKSPYEGNGLKREFDITFDWLKGHQEHIKVYVRNGAGVLAETTNYKMEQDKSTEVWKVEYLAVGEPLAEGEKLIIVRELPLVQVLNLVNQGPFFAEDVELTFDEVVMMIQQLGERVGRSLKFGVDIDAENEFDTTIPMVPGKTFRVREDGKGLESTEDPGLAYEKAAVARDEAIVARNIAVDSKNIAVNAKDIAVERASYTEKIISAGFLLAEDLCVVDGKVCLVFNEGDE